MQMNNSNETYIIYTRFLEGNHLAKEGNLVLKSETKCLDRTLYKILIK